MATPMDGPALTTSAAPQTTPLHRAIDRASVALLTVQRIRNRLMARESDEELAIDLATIDAALHALGDLLVEFRDTPRP